MNNPNDIPVYKRLISALEKSFHSLAPEVQKEIIGFIGSQQDASGGFIDRAGNPDPYYSLFGLWLSIAGKQNQNIESLKSYLDKNISTSSPVEELALALIKAELKPNQRKKSAFSLVKKFLRNNNQMDISYRFFLLALTIDATAKTKTFFNFFARIWLRFYSPKGNLPCSVVAALTYARLYLRLKTGKFQKKLMHYHIKNAGFKAFENIKISDTLSTGVALFTLAETGFDLRTITPDCLNFIEINYKSGAFLSGDGDETRDLEYTFYGLLALGSLSSN